MDVLGLFRLEYDDQRFPELPVVILTVVCYSVSILLFSTHLIVFSFTRKMWTTMGKNLASFCMSTILGYCAYISSIAAKHDRRLYSIGILLAYYCALTHSSWLLTMSFECWRSCSKTKSQRAFENAHTNRFVWYSLFSWLQPAIFLGLALYAEFGNVPETILPNYLKPTFVTSGVGYFRPISAFVLFFVGPLCFNLLLNVLFLARTNCLIGRLANDLDYSVESTETVWEFNLYSRFNLLITLTWLANLVDALVTRNIICNVFIISLSAAQALYVLLVFTFNNKISTLMHYENEELNLKTFMRKADVGSTWGRSNVV